ncbi:MAG TPA: exosortase A [Sphingomonas sp.]|jgi:exosortase A
MTAAFPRIAFAAQGRWPRHLLALGATSIALLLMFRADVTTLVHLWWTSTTFGHCLFIGPVIGWLVWQRRGEVGALTPEAWAPGLAIVAGGGAAWWIGDAASVALARQLGLVVMLQGLVATLLGSQVSRGLLFPLAYAFFLVPFGQELEPPLQAVTVAIVMPLLALVGVPATVDGVLIHAGRYWFEVAEACSGAKFVIAMAAFGVLVAHLCFWSWRRRAIFMVVALFVPVLANGLRAFATIWAADLTSVEAATGMDHIVYGWVFFALVMAGVLALGWRWFDRAPDDPAFDATCWARVPGLRIEPVLAVVLALSVAAVFPAWADVAGRPAALPARIELPVVAGWTRAPLSTAAPWEPHHPGADHRLFGRYAAASGARIDVGVALFASQAEGRELVSFGTGALRENDRWVRVADLPPLAGGRTMRIAAPGPVERVVATWYRVGDATTASPFAVKLATLRARLIGRPRPAMAIHMSAEGPGAAVAIEAFVRDAGGIDAVSARIAKGVR